MRTFTEGGYTITLPGDLDGVANGQVPGEHLAPFRSKWRLYRDAVPVFEAFFAAVKRELGFDLVFINGSGSAYRPWAEQRSLFLARHYVSSSGPFLFEGKRYALRAGMASAACPTGGKILRSRTWVDASGSNHGWGLAADICHLGQIALSAAQRAQLRPIAARFDIADTVKSENWHWVALNAVRTAAALGAVSGPASTVQAPPTSPPASPPMVFPKWDPANGEPGLWPKLPAESYEQLPVLKVGSDGDAVRYLECSLRFVANQPDTPITGRFDDALGWRVLAWQEAVRVYLDPAMVVDGNISGHDYAWLATMWAFSGRL